MAPRKTSPRRRMLHLRIFAAANNSRVERTQGNIIKLDQADWPQEPVLNNEDLKPWTCDSGQRQPKARHICSQIYPAKDINENMES